MSYRLPCDHCGRAYPVEPRQAGDVITCECGAKLQIPTMLKIKRLEPWVEDEAPKSDDVETNEKKAPETVDAATADATKESAATEKKPKLSAKRRALFLLAALVFVGSVFFVARNVKTPDPRRVFYKQTTYDLGDGRKIRRDSSPITMEDYSFYYATDFSDPQRRTFIITNEYFDYMSPFELVRYFELVKNLEMSDNFYENFEALKTRRVITLVSASIMALVSLIVALYALFAKETQKQVGSMRGSEWR